MAYINFQPSDHFNAKLYTGNGSTNAITGVGFQPDWVWCKKRNSAQDHGAVDAVRGVTKVLYPNLDSAESTDANSVTAFGTDGFTLGSSGDFNQNSDTYVSWNWKANGAGSSNTDGSINTTSTSVNTTAGFSISKYTGTGSNATVGHGLGAVPKMMIVKDIGTSVDWIVYHSELGNTKNMRFNTNEQVDTSSTIWNNTTPTSSVFSIGTSSGVNGSGNNYIAYCFTEKTGFSKFGSYIGNGSTWGSFINCGFKPAFIMCRFTGSGNGYDWIIYDSKRPNSSNSATNILEVNNSAAEDSSSNFNCDILSNGFKFRGTESNVNDNGASYLYMAFAEEPLVSSNEVPATAR